MRTGTLLLLATLLVARPESVLAQNPTGPEKPLKHTEPPTAAQLVRLRDGARLHDEGKFDEAIALYQGVLAESPDCKMALAELANSYLGKHDLPRTIEFATRALEYDDADQASVYVALGSAYDDMGQTDKAIETFKRGLAVAPDGLLYYNLAVTLESHQRIDEALEQYKHAAFVIPNHATTQFALARIFAGKGYLSQSLFALSRFLILEPATQRTATAYPLWFNGFLGNLWINADGKLNVPTRIPPDKGEGYFLQADVTVGVSRAGALGGATGKPPSQVLVTQLDFWFGVLTKTDQPEVDRTAFAWRYYVPYFVELQRLGYTEPFIYWISQRTNIPGVQEWIADPANRQRATEFVQWSQQYVWPKE